MRCLIHFFLYLRQTYLCFKKGRLMKKFLIFLLLVFSVGNAFAQLYKPINGGYYVSACVNTEGKVFVCGNNYKQLLGVENKNEIITSFTEVSYFTENNIHVTQVSVDGTYFLALDCKGNVYEWGSRTLEEIISPRRVPSGCVQGTEWDENGYLTNVISVYSQGHVLFALLSDHRVVSWGYADEYSPGIGNGTDITYTESPVFVNTLDGPITNVIQISSCSFAAYFLVDDDNDGKGVVYSYGTGQRGTLGRKEENINYALPIMTLSNIVSISSSNVSAMALDEDGYVWTWGQNDWGGVCGWGRNVDSDKQGIPSRVVKGETNKEDNDGMYLLARDISAGMDFCVAVTHGGKVVAWGGNNNDSGFLGIGKTGDASYSPIYVKISEEENLSNCVAVQCGNFSAYAITTDNDIYAWGCNEQGELGVGNTQGITYATVFSLPISCNLFSLSPTVNITPKYKLLPNSSFLPITINSGFNIGEQYASQYTIRWFKDDVLVSSGLVSEIGSTYSATDFGTYHVEVERTMNVADCKSIVEIATSEPAEIKEMTPDFFVEKLVSDCKDSATLYVTPTGNNTTAEFVWWADAQKTHSVGMSVGDEQITIDVEDLKDSQGNTTLYLEEKAATKGVFLSQKEYQGSSSSETYDFLNSGQYAPCGTGFSVLSDYIVLSSIDFSARIDLNAWSASETNPITRTYVFEIEIFEAKEMNGGFVSDKTKMIGKLGTNFSLTATSSARQEIERSCFGEVELSRGQYFAVLKLKNISEGMVQIVSYNQSYSQTISDNVDGKQITLLGIEAWGNPSYTKRGNLYNFVFTTPSEFTNLVPIIIASECECTIPKRMTISQSIENNVLCSGEIQLEPSAQEVSDLFTYEWLKDGEVVTEPILTNQLVYTATHNGIYTVRVRNQENEECQKTAQKEILFKKNKGDYVPKISLSKTDPICETSNGSITTTIEGGTEPYSIRWNDEITDKDRTNLAVGVYTITATDLYGCFDTKSITLTKNVSNMPQISANVEHAICGHDVGSISLSVTKGVQPYTYSWENGETSLERTNLSPGKYSFSVTDMYGCVSDWSTTIIPRTIQYNPEIALVTVSQEIEAANLVVWQKEETQALDFYTIYREKTENGVTDFKPIATVPYAETSLFVDENTNNMQQAYKYKISATDNCGQESSLSEYHKTIHLTKGQALQGVNLIWDGYAGFDVRSYSIFRITTTGVDEIAEVSADTWTYTDLKPAAGTISYYVGVRLPKEIDVNEPFQKAESGPFVIAISNIAEVENQGTPIALVDENSVNVYSAHNAIVVENAGENQIIVCNALGQTIARVKAENDIQKTFAVEAGIYIVIVGNKAFKVAVE